MRQSTQLFNCQELHFYKLNLNFTSIKCKISTNNIIHLPEVANKTPLVDKLKNTANCSKL